MKPIASRENPLYKELKQLATSSQARRKAGLTLLDGVHLCEAYLQHVGMPLRCVLNQEFLHHPEVTPIVAQCEAAQVTCVALPDALYRTLSQVEHGIGLLFIIQVPQTTQPAALTQAAVLLDSLQDPGNLGSILRSAAAAGIQQIFCSPATAAAWSPKVLRAGMGAHFLLQIFENADLSGLAANSSIPLFATSSHASKNIFESDLSQPAAWLFGHEGQGISDDLLALATQQISIPHLGPMESLNAAAAAAICLFEQVRQKQISR